MRTHPTAKRALVLLALAIPAAAQYAGPAILSRGEAPAAMATPQIDFRPYVDVSAVYDSGLAGVAVNDQGQLANQTSTGVSLSWGVSGLHSWRHTKLGLNYLGSLSHYPRNGTYDSIDQSFMLGLTHQFSRHIMFTLHQSAGLMNRNFGVLGLSQTVPFDPSTSNIPTTDYFDNRTIFLSTQAGIVIQKTARLSFDLGGGIFTTRRRSDALSGVTGTSAGGDVQYRLTRRSTVGATYTFAHYGFSRIFGTTDAHGVAGTYAYQITRRWEFSGFAGFYRVESKFIQTAPIDPTIAALLGISTAQQVAHVQGYTPNLSGRLSHVFHRGVIYVAGGRSVTPGNGLFLTSYSTGVLGGYTYTGLRRWSFNSGAGYTRSGATGIITGTYGGANAGVSLSRQLSHGMNFILSYSARQYQSASYANYNRLITEARVGFGFAPGDIPLRIW